MKKFLYVIDLNERGYFAAHVENEKGKIVLNIENDDDGSVWLIEAGYMRHGEDVNGLFGYLVKAGICKDGDRLDIEK